MKKIIKREKQNKRKIKKEKMKKIIKREKQNKR